VKDEIVEEDEGGVCEPRRVGVLAAGEQSGGPWNLHSISFLPTTALRFNFAVLRRSITRPTESILLFTRLVASHSQVFRIR
jgi:hypothetical protein